MAHFAIEVADKFIRLGIPKNKFFTQMQILKLVYIAHGWTLAIENKPLIIDKIEAWQYGPVIPTLYQQLKDYGSSEIHNPILYQEKFFTPSEEEIIKFTFQSYSDFSAFELSNITHAPNTPWSNIYDYYSRFDVIPDDMISEHYKSLYTKYFGSV